MGVNLVKIDPPPPPKRMVKKWQWVYKMLDDSFRLTPYRMTREDAQKYIHYHYDDKAILHRPLPESEIEVEE